MSTLVFTPDTAQWQVTIAHVDPTLDRAPGARHFWVAKENGFKALPGFFQTWNRTPDPKISCPTPSVLGHVLFINRFI